MAKAWVHSCSSAKRFGGTPEDYIPIHNHLDSTKGVVADNRHRAMTHNAWYIGPDGPLEKAFGIVITNSEGHMIAVRAIAELHLLEDFGGYIPSLQDYLQSMTCEPWMNGHAPPPSAKRLKETMHHD